MVNLSRYGYRQCSTCDAWYFEGDRDEEKIHRHQEPQSGEPRKSWLGSGLEYERWAEETEEGRKWAKL